MATVSIDRLSILGRIAVLSTALIGAVREAPVVQAQGATVPSPRLSPTLYFADSLAQRSGYAALHARIDPLVHAIADADSSSLTQCLRDGNQALVALQRHAAYLKVQTLENTEDRVARGAY